MMTRKLVEVVEAIGQRLQQLSGLPIANGPLPANGGAAIAHAGGDVTRHMDGGASVKLRVAVNTKDMLQMRAIEMQDQIHAAVVMAALEGGSWQITGTSIKAMPSLMGQDSAGYWLYHSVIEVRVYFAAPEVIKK